MTSLSPQDLMPEDPDQRIAPAPSNASAAFDARILKNLDCLAVLDSFGDAHGAGAAEGLFYQDTRYLSQLMLTVGGRRPLLLSSSAIDDGITIRTDLANPDIIERDGIVLQKEKIHIARTQEIGTDAFFDTIEVTNYQTYPVDIAIGVIFDADFADMFEVRGARRDRRGKLLADQGDASSQIIGYEGLDSVIRQTQLNFEPKPDISSARQRGWRLKLGPQERQTIAITIRFERDGQTSGISLKEAGSNYAGWRHQRREQTAHLKTSDRGFSDWLRRSRFDLEMLVTPTTRGLIAYAGTPWYSTAFGRDSLITALQCLWLDPALAEGTLRYLAATQATEEIAAADAEPGKILHETRQGEMALLGEVPFRLYYGSVDSTPLFVMLAAAYYRRTGDLDFIRELWPSIEKALYWIEHYGDIDGDGLLEYGRRSSDGLVNQGWKDSDDAIFHANGSTPEQPIAVVEVQGYAYEAWKGGADLATALGKPEDAERYLHNAERTRTAFQEKFWLDDLQTFAIALDGKKRPCRVRSSNAGHILLSGLAAPEQAIKVADTLMHPDSFSGWGIRTIAAGEARFNPMSYHNGSIWPHDNALIAMGFARYGLSEHLGTLVSQMFQVSRFVGQNRLPELFCGFTRREGMGPSAYPVACSPQAWAAASVFGLMGALLGISFDAAAGRIKFTKPMLLPFLQQVRLDNLRVGDAAVDLILNERDHQVTVGTLRQTGAVEVVIT